MEEKKKKILPGILLFVNCILYTFIYLMVLILNIQFGEVFREMLNNEIPTMTKIVLNQATITVLYVLAIVMLISNKYLPYSEKIRTSISGCFFLFSFMFFIFYIYCLFQPLIYIIRKLQSGS